MANIYFNALSTVFSPLLALPPIIGELLLAILLTFITTIFYRYLADQNKIRELKEKQKELQKKIKELKSKPEEANNMSKELLGLTNKQMMMNMKPMFMTMIIIVMLLPWMAFAFSGQIALLPFSLPFFGNDFGWLMWYFVVSIPFTQLFRKMLGVE